MGNCLVTKLKENVNNIDLIQVGHFRMTVPVASDALIVIANGGELFDVKSVNNQSINAEQITNFNSSNYDILDGTILDISDKYTLSSLNVNAVIFVSSQFKYSPLSFIRIRNCENLQDCHLEDLVNSAGVIDTVDINNSPVDGNVEVLSGHVGNELPISISIYYNNYITGSLDTTIAQMINGSSIAIQYCNENLKASRSVIDAAVARGVTCNINEANIVED